MKKKEIKAIQEIFAEVLKNSPDRREPAVAVNWDSPEVQALAKDNEFLRRIEQSMSEWAEAYADKRINQLTGEYQKQVARNERALKRNVKQLRQAEMQLYKVKSKIRNEHRDITEANEEIKSLKKDVKRLKEVVINIGALDGIAPVNSSLKDVQHAYKRRLGSLKHYDQGKLPDHMQ